MDLFEQAVTHPIEIFNHFLSALVIGKISHHPKPSLPLFLHFTCGFAASFLLTSLI